MKLATSSWGRRNKWARTCTVHVNDCTPPLGTTINTQLTQSFLYHRRRATKTTPIFRILSYQKIGPLRFPTHNQQICSQIFCDVFLTEIRPYRELWYFVDQCFQKAQQFDNQHRKYDAFPTNQMASWNCCIVDTIVGTDYYLLNEKVRKNISFS